MFDLGYGLTTAVVIGLIIFLILSGMRIAFALLVTGILALYFLVPRPMLGSTAAAMWSQLNSFSLTATTLFILMGEFLMRGGLGAELYSVMDKWFNRLPGGLAQVNIAACALFASISGSSIATAATLGVIAVPEMERRHYDRRLTFGSLAGGGTLGILIPPSVIMIIYGAMAETSVGKLFIAGIVPGLLLAVMFMVFIAAWAMKSPAIAPRTLEAVSWNQRWAALIHLLPTALLVFVVLGGIYAGVVTPTEAAALGAVFALVLAAAKRKVTWSMLKGSSMETLFLTAMLNVIVAGAATIAFMFHFMRIPVLLTEAVTNLGLSPYIVYLAVCVIYLILGMFIDGVSMIVITIPTVVPLLEALGFDRVWTGIVLVICVELSLITPPVGMNLFVLQGIARDVPLHVIALGAVPYVAIMGFMLALLAAFPEIALWLPGRMTGT